MIGTTLSHFKITAKLGEGGMGEVYRAEDMKLGREVVIKLLPADLVEDAERLARFEREAKVLASLNHPHIAAIYSLDLEAGESQMLLQNPRAPRYTKSGHLLFMRGDQLMAAAFDLDRLKIVDAPAGASPSSRATPDTGGTSLTYVDLVEGGEPKSFLEGPNNKSDPAFSPDSLWLAFISDESGRAEVHVAAFPGPGPNWMISSGGGARPQWSRIPSPLTDSHTCPSPTSSATY